MRVYVELSQDVDVASWARRHADGLAADATPYGLHHLREFGHAVRFRGRLPERLSYVGRVSAGRAAGMQIVPSLLGLGNSTRRSADVVLCMDERNGLPALLLPSPVPVLTGIAWLEDPTELPPWYRHLAVRGLRRAAGVFVECSAMREPLVRDFGVPEDRLHDVTLGIDEAHFSPSPQRPVPGRVFSVGDDRMRDYDTLIAALQQARNRHPGLVAEVATTLPVELPREWTIVHRRRMDHAVRQCYRDAAVVALALKRTRQGSGLTVILEAMASGRPVVVTDNPGLDDYVSHGETGLLVPGGSPQAMADAIDSLLSDPDRAEAMGRAGRRKVEKRFTTRHMSADLSAALAKTVGGFSHSSR